MKTKEKKIVYILIGTICILIVILSAILIGKKIEYKKQLEHSIQAVNVFYTQMENVEKNIDECESLKEMKKVLADSEAIVKAFDEFDTSARNEVDIFIDQIRALPVYKLYENDYVTGEALTDDTEIIHDFFVAQYQSIIHEVINSILIEKPGICDK